MTVKLCSASSLCAVKPPEEDPKLQQNCYLNSFIEAEE